MLTPDLPKAGAYEVSVKWVASKPDDRATDAPFTVRSAEGEPTTLLLQDGNEALSVSDDAAHGPVLDEGYFCLRLWQASVRVYRVRVERLR